MVCVSYLHSNTCQDFSHTLLAEIARRFPLGEEANSTRRSGGIEHRAPSSRTRRRSGGRDRPGPARLQRRLRVHPTPIESGALRLSRGPGSVVAGIREFEYWRKIHVRRLPGCIATFSRGLGRRLMMAEEFAAGSWAAHHWWSTRCRSTGAEAFSRGWGTGSSA